MTEKSRISIAAFVSENERALMQSAAGRMAQTLSQASDIPWTCDCAFAPDLTTLQSTGDASIIVTSLLPQLEKLDEPWKTFEQRLRTAYTALGERGIPVFICTILRHVGRCENPEAAAALLIRLRRLNLLAAEISRETGAYVIDLDRDLANIGARWLQTDYRLAGNTANLGGYFIALTLITNGCDAFLPFEMQEAALSILTSGKPVVATDNSRALATLKKDLVSLGHGRRKQVVAPVNYTVDENYAGWLVRQILRGAIEPAEILRRLVQAVRRRGLRESAVLLAYGLSKQINRRR